MVIISLNQLMKSSRVVQQLINCPKMRFMRTMFVRNRVADPYQSLRIIAEHALTHGSRKTALKNVGNERLSACSYRLVLRLAQHRFKHEPLQYLVGEWPFRSLMLKMRAPVLIPRFETENMVSVALEAVRRHFKAGQQLNIVDFGCGSGAIALSLLQELKDNYQVKAYCVDLSPQAIQLTKANARRNGIGPDRFQMVRADMLESLQLIKKCQLVVSNPPYLPKKSYHRLQKQVKLYEDRNALVGGIDGLKFITSLVNAIREEQAVRKDLIGVLEYDGSDVSCLGYESNILRDQYSRRRYLLLEPLQ